MKLASTFRCAFHGGLQIQVGDQAMEVIGVQAEDLGGLGEVSLSLFEGGEEELFLGFANSVVEIGGGLGAR